MFASCTWESIARGGICGASAKNVAARCVMMVMYRQWWTMLRLLEVLKQAYPLEERT